ncbi:MAG: DsrE family protein [Rhodospirillaceae bacterium]|nr:DsrE family protein [Rhodospirillaceae bacterium]
MLALGVATLLPMSSALAGSTDPLFINLTTDDQHRVDMALSFGGNQLKRGHPLTVFLNDHAVLVAAKSNNGKFEGQQGAIQQLLANGAVILVCPMCMKHYGVSESDLVPGVLVGNPERTGGLLFQDNAKTLSW